MSDSSANIGTKFNGAGSSSLAGYEYQIDVSIWLALDLILASKLTQELVLEPASQEDIEAELQENEPGRVTSTASLDGYTLVVQAKLRSGDAWTAKPIKALLEHGERRQPAVERLNARNVRYLLVTSAALNSDARGLRVRRAGVWPSPSSVPALIARILPADGPGRVAVIGSQDEERLTTDIKRLLTESFRIPNASWEKCLAALREEARIRISGGGSGRWRRGELERVIHDHDGYFASSPELERYVHPTNWCNLRSAMQDRHAALIIGQSGTGKTMATKKLYEELRQEIPGLAHVPIRLGPRELRDDRTQGPVLYDIEDPWGRFDFDPSSRPWNDQLAQFFANATHDRMIVATSRLDVAQASGALETVKPWLIALEAEHYGKRERARLYRSRIEGLPRNLQTLATQEEAKVLVKLATPLEIQKYFDALRTLDRDELKNPSSFINEAIRRAHQDSIERTVIDQIEGRNDIRASAVVWGLLKAADKLSLRVLRILEEGFAEKDQSMSEGVTPFVDFFVAARNLRQGEGTVTYYHPRVEAGIEQALKRQPLIVRRTLRLLVDLLVSSDGPGQDWGAGAAARLIAAVEKKTDLKPSLSQAAEARIDDWLAARLAEGGKEFEVHLLLAAAAGSKNSNEGEIARYLLHRPDKTFGNFDSWGSPGHSETWYARCRDNPATEPLIETFVKEVLPTSHDTYPSSFANDIERLVPDLSDAFLAAAAKAVHYGVLQSDDTIAEGALRDLQRFEAIIDTAIEVLTPSQEELREADKMHLALVNGEYSDDYAEYIQDNDDGYTARVFLGAYVQRVRATTGWRSLVHHRHRDRLLFYWFRDLTKAAETAAPDPEEIAEAFAAGYGRRDEDDLWLLLLRAWQPQYLPSLRARVAEGHPNPRVRQAALTCLTERASSELTVISHDLIHRGEMGRLIEIAIDLANLHHRSSWDGEHHEAAALAAIAILPAVLAELSNAALALMKKDNPTLSEKTCSILRGLQSESEAVRRFRVAMDVYYDLLVDDDVRWLLANTDDDDTAVDAIETAIRRNMIAEVRTALDHKFAQVVARALRALGEPMSAPLPDEFLAKATDRRSPVRKALVALMDAKPHSMHLPTLLLLAKDTWSSMSRYWGESDEFPIAQAAVAALEKQAPLGQDADEQLFSVAIDTTDSTLRSLIFRLLTKTAGPEIQVRLFDLAVAPGRIHIRRTAAGALLQEADVIATDVLEKITPEILETKIEPVAVALTLLFAWRCKVDAVRSMAERLATNSKRRVLLLLMIWLMKDRNLETAHAMAAMLPAGHPAVNWALGSTLEVVNDALIADLGAPNICAQVLIYMKTNRE